MTDPKLFRTIVTKAFLEAQAKNPKFSMRSYARKLGMSQATLSLIMSGKRMPSAKMAQKILRGTGEMGFDAKKMLEENFGIPEQKARSLSGDEFRIVSEWHYFAILNLTNTVDFKNDCAWIAERLNLTADQATEALSTLISMGLLLKDAKTGAVRANDKPVEAISKVPSLALRKANEQNLILAQKALDKIPVAERDFTAVTLCFDPRQLEEARKLIKTFRRSFAEIMEASEKKEVYKLCLQLFPLTGSAQ